MQYAMYLNNQLDVRMITKINLNEKFSLFSEHWNPKILAELNDNYIKVVKLKGNFVWHQHEEEDEMFFVIEGKLIIELKNQEDIILRNGEFVVIPKGMDHRTIAENEVQVLLIEPKTTVNTGNQTDKRTKLHLEKI